MMCANTEVAPALAASGIAYTLMPGHSRHAPPGAALHSRGGGGAHHLGVRVRRARRPALLDRFITVLGEELLRDPVGGEGARRFAGARAARPNAFPRAFRIFSVWASDQALLARPTRCCVAFVQGGARRREGTLHSVQDALSILHVRMGTRSACGAKAPVDGGKPADAAFAPNGTSRGSGMRGRGVFAQVRRWGLAAGRPLCRTCPRRGERKREVYGCLKR